MYKARIINSTSIVASSNSESTNLSRIEDYAVQAVITDQTPDNDTFADGDVDTTDDEVTITGHAFITGDKVQLSNSGGALPGGLSASTDYWIISVDANTISFASSLANAQAGTAIDITSAAGGGTHTIEVETLSATLKLQASNDDANWADISGTTNNITTSGNVVINIQSAGYKYVRVALTHTAGRWDAEAKITGKERKI